MSVTAVYSQLTGFAGLTALIGSRVYRGSLPQNPTYPLILYTVEEEPLNSLDGSSGLSRFEYEFEIYGATYDAVSAIAAQLESALTSAATFNAFLIASADDDYQDDTLSYSIFQTYSIW